MITFGSLFSGIGGIDLGLERSGMVCKWQVEKDEFCRKVLQKHWPEVRRYEDVREVGKHNLEPVDLICGGFPCQPFSVAGKRRGKADDRYLWKEMLKVIAAARPRWVLAENVPGIIKMELDTVLSDLEAEGYTTGALVIPACAVDAPHRRDRVWIVAHTRLQRQKEHEKQATRIEQSSQVVAHNGLRKSVELSGCEQTCRDGNIYGCQDVAHASNTGLQGSKQRETLSEGTGTSRPVTECCEDVRECQFCGYEFDHALLGKYGCPNCEGYWFPQPRLGMPPNGFSGWMVRAWGTGEWEDGVSRVTLRVPDRANRLKSLGNAIVPHVAYEIIKSILAVEKTIK